MADYLATATLRCWLDIKEVEESLRYMILFNNPKVYIITYKQLQAQFWATLLIYSIYCVRFRF